MSRVKWLKLTDTSHEAMIDEPIEGAPAAEIYFLNGSWCWEVHFGEPTEGECDSLGEARETVMDALEAWLEAKPHELAAIRKEFG